MKKTVVITGAAGNLGQAVIRRFLQENYQVAAVTQPGHPNQIETLRQLAGPSDQIRIQELDVAQEAQTRQFVDDLTATYPKINAAVLLVGGFAMGGIAETDEALMDRMIGLNFKSAYLLARPLFLHMKEKGGGRIVLVGARTAVEANSGKGILAYSLAKTMIVKLADLFNVEGKAHGVVTSVIVPNIIDTPQNRADMPKANFDTWVKPEAIADVIAFACSPAAQQLDEPVFKIYGHQ
jgi:NAD(P)-dependent dehydrogenase (short-subunit alcohol dehydrogenase family)